MTLFKQSPVVFNEDEHRYELDGKRLLGITGLIHSILGLGVYPEANNHVKDEIIPRAGSRGTAVHHAIQTYDCMGIRQTTQTVHTRYGCAERDNIRYVDEVWDVDSELDNYIRHLEGFTPLANELTVSDNYKWASQIDNVWRNNQTGGIWLVDTKTNNIKLYPTCGYFCDNYFSSGEDALKEYLSWQLSIYAELFEDENPGMEVEGLACNWLRKDEAEFWHIERKPYELVKELLSSDYIFTDNGPVYFHRDLSVFGIGKAIPATTEPAVPIMHPEVVDYLNNLYRNYKALGDKLEEAKRGLRTAMEQYSVKKYDFGSFTATIAADTVSNTFDTKRFKAEHPDMYEEYVTQKVKKGGLTIKPK